MQQPAGAILMIEQLLRLLLVAGNFGRGICHTEAPSGADNIGQDGGCAALAIAPNAPASKLAPPTSAPSTFGQPSSGSVIGKPA